MIYYLTIANVLILTFLNRVRQGGPFPRNQNRWASAWPTQNFRDQMQRLGQPSRLILLQHWPRQMLNIHRHQAQDLFCAWRLITCPQDICLVVFYAETKQKPDKCANLPAATFGIALYQQRSKRVQGTQHTKQQKALLLAAYLDLHPLRTSLESDWTHLSCSSQSIGFHLRTHLGLLLQWDHKRRNGLAHKREPDIDSGSGG